MSVAESKDGFASTRGRQEQTNTPSFSYEGADFDTIPLCTMCSSRKCAGRHRWYCREAWKINSASRTATRS